ncbi:MAG: Uma2 family endonuclease [Solirubrobacterales bacterium]|nr:Uma2 family endonuclease [Solirubrobacterales bacterium]MBV9535186.1 Uma2 family endonuclease [Solirubrobacterales bacterium]
MPDAGVHRSWTDRVWYDTATLVVEIVSPGDESWEKLDFYAAHGVEELLIVDPQEKTVNWLGLDASEYKQLQRSRLVELSASELAERIAWP